MRKLLILFALFTVVSANAQRYFEMDNSKDGASKLYVYLPAADKATGRAVVCCPGGGYGHLSMELEGTSWAPFYNDMGVAFILLKYRLPKGDRSLPITDAEHAIITVRDSAKVWNINPNDVGIQGFSAGGHLASTIATHADTPARPNFQILYYPVISMDKTKGHRGSSENFLGKDVDDKDLIKEFSNENKVMRHFTPPAFIIMSDDDRVVPPLTNGVPYYMALRKNHIPASMHIYPMGGHGWRPENFPYYEEARNTLKSWLEKLQAPKADAIKVACVGNSITFGSGIDLSATRGYPAQLQQMLSNGYYVRNFGLGARTMLSTGDHPYMNEYAWKDCKEFNPDIVIIKLGTNDSKTENWNAKQYEKDLQKMIDELKALKSKPRIILGYPAKAWKRQWNIREEVITGEIIPIIDRVAKKNKLEIVDFHTPTATSSDLFTSDMIHPNEKGAKVLAETAKAAILK